MRTMEIILALLLALASQTVLANYNCTRLGVDCYGTCSPTTGACFPCNRGYEGHDCTLRTDTKNVGGCASGNPCKNGGICVGPSMPGVAITSCYCPYEYYGDTCHFPRVSNECFNDRMIVNVNPGKNFAGIVGLQSPTGFCDISPVNNLLTSAAPFILAGGRNRWEGYAAELPFSMDPCGGSPTITKNASTTTYTYDVLVQYDVMSMSPGLDELVTFSCTVSNNPAGSGRTAVLFSITDEQGLPVETPKLGSAVTVAFSVDPSSIFEDITVKSCTVFDSSRRSSVPVVVDSCAVPPFGRSLVKSIRGRNSLSMVIHKFSTDARLTFECRVKVCMPNDYTCVMPTLCDARTGSMMGGGTAGTGTMSFSSGTNMGTGTGTGTGSKDPMVTALDPLASLMAPSTGTAGTGLATDPMAGLGGLDLSSLGSLTNLLGRRRREAESTDTDNIVIVKTVL